MTDTASSGPTRGASRDDRNLAFAGYGLLCASPFVFGLTALVAVVIAYVRRCEAAPLEASHFRFQIRLFWVGFVLAMICALSLLTAIGFALSGLIDVVHDNFPRDAWDAASTEVTPRISIAMVIALITFFAAYVAAGLWSVMAGLYGLGRLMARAPVGRVATV